MPLKPWYKLVTPREDLREGKPLDAAEFAVHLDQVRDGRDVKGDGSIFGSPRRKRNNPHWQNGKVGCVKNSRKRCLIPWNH